MARLYRDATTAATPERYDVFSCAPYEALLAEAHPLWHETPWVAWGPARFRTRFRARWAPAGLAVRFDCADEDPWHTMRSRDDHLWEEEVVELFLDPAGRGTDYAEIEISPGNVVCDLRIREAWPRLRGDLSWDLAGLDTRVVHWRPGDETGARNARAPGRGWTALALIPWQGLTSLSAAVAARVPPAAGDRWRFNVFRIKRPGGAADPERDAIFAAWSVPDGPSFHAPGAFRELWFQDRGDHGRTARPGSRRRRLTREFPKRVPPRARGCQPGGRDTRALAR
jgi:hypothetical protein